MLGILFRGGRQGDHRFLAEAVRGRHLGHRRPAVRDRPGLVEDHGVYPARNLQGRAALEEEPELGAAPGAHHHRDRRGEAQGAGAGDDEHGGEAGEGEGQAPSRDEPGDERKKGDADHRRYEPPGDDVGQPRNGGLLALGVLHQLDDARERRVPAHLLGPEEDGAVFVQAAAVHRAAFGFFDRDGFAREHRFVHRGVPLDHRSVDRNPLARAHAYEVARLKLADRDRFLDAVLHQDGGPGRQAEQLLDGQAGPALGKGLQHLAEEDEGDDDAGGLEVKLVDGRRVPEPDPHRGGEAEDQRGRGADGDERVHVGMEAHERGEAAGVEAAAGEHGRQGEREDGQGVGEGVGHRREERGEGQAGHGRHGEEQERHGEGQGEEERAFERPGLAVLPVLMLVPGAVASLLERGVAGLHDGVLDFEQPHFPGPEGDVGLFRGQIDGRPLHAGHGAQGPFNAGAARGAGHASDREDRLFERSRLRCAGSFAARCTVPVAGNQLVPQFFHRFGDGVRIQLAFVVR